MIELTSSDKDTQRFFDFLYKTLKRYKCVLKISSSDVFIDNNMVDGYFSWDSKEIMICIESINWLSTLVHEFCHLLIYKSCTRKENNLRNKALGNMFDWVSHDIELDEKEIIRSVNIVKHMELECERKTVEIIKEYSLPIDIVQYTKEANAYVLFHDFVKLNRQWTTSTYIANMTKVLECMSSEFDMDYANISYPLLELYSEYA